MYHVEAGACYSTHTIFGTKIFVVMNRIYHTVICVEVELPIEHSHTIVFNTEEEFTSYIKSNGYHIMERIDYATV